MNAEGSRTRVALIGYGEVGQTLAADLKARGVADLTAWDRLFTLADSIPSRAAAVGPVRAADGIADALADRSLVISAVTAGECLAVAREAAASITPDAFYFDLNSVAPRTKIDAAQVIESAGGRFVEAAVMSPIAPKRVASPILIGGPHAESFARQARDLGFAGVEVFDARVGRASATKMCRSVMIKGLEALFTESLLAARHYGVDSAVVESLGDLLPHGDWRRLAGYMISRSVRHGRRRAEEMREATRAVGDAGIDPWMSTACAMRQDWAAGRIPLDERAQLGELLDALAESTSVASGENA